MVNSEDPVQTAQSGSTLFAHLQYLPQYLWHIHVLLNQNQYIITCLQQMSKDLMRGIDKCLRSTLNIVSQSNLSNGSPKKNMKIGCLTHVTH